MGTHIYPFCLSASQLCLKWVFWLTNYRQLGTPCRKDNLIMHTFLYTTDTFTTSKLIVIEACNSTKVMVKQDSLKRVKPKFFFFFFLEQMQPDTLMLHRSTILVILPKSSSSLVSAYVAFTLLPKHFSKALCRVLYAKHLHFICLDASRPLVGKYFNCDTTYSSSFTLWGERHYNIILKNTLTSYWPPSLG